VELYAIIIGGGQCRLELTARLQFLDVPTLMLENSDRIGNQWRGGYESSCLHNLVCESCLLSP
jgi:putative flavoprotein involved in K+ transport